MGLFNFFSKKEKKAPDFKDKVDRKSINTKQINDLQQKHASEGYQRLAYEKFFKNFPEMPFISRDRELNTNWVEQAEMFPSNIIKPEKMMRLSNGLLPGHVYLLYWLSHNKKSNIPGYFEYEYGICAKEEMEYLKQKGYLSYDGVVTIQGLNVISNNPDVISEKKGRKNNPAPIKSLGTSSDFEKAVDNNLKGIHLEKKGQDSKAIELYKKNVAKRFDGNHPYDRLAIYYRKRKEYDKEIDVLEKAIDVFTHDVSVQRSDRLPKLKKFKDRLIRAKELKAKQSLG